MTDRTAVPALVLVTGIAACIVLHARTADGLTSTDDVDTPEHAKVTVRGTVVDDVTGLPLKHFITQSGKFEPGDPGDVAWGYGETRNGSSSWFSVTVRWPEGWTARILADGYVPQPVLTEAPLPGQEVIEVVLRMKRGRLVKGWVLDHRGQPVTGAAVFAIGPTGLNLAGGKAWESVGERDEENLYAKPARTDEEGRFELQAGSATRLAVSCKALDAWPSAIPEAGEAVVRLPAPATVHIRYNIDGADDEAGIGYQFLNHRMPGFEGLESSCYRTIRNGDTRDLTGMTPGKYQFWRVQRHRMADFGTGAMLDRQFFELKAGETTTINFVREKGARVHGTVTWAKGDEPAGVVVSINSMEQTEDPFGGHMWETTYASTLAAPDGSFATEQIAPGRYRLKAEGYLPLTDQQRYSTGVIMPALTADVVIEVPDSGELNVPDLVLSRQAPRGR